MVLACCSWTFRKRVKKGLIIRIRPNSFDESIQLNYVYDGLPLEKKENSSAINTPEFEKELVIFHFL